MRLGEGVADIDARKKEPRESVLRHPGRWRWCWRETFVASSFWQGAKGRFLQPVDAQDLLLVLLEQFASASAREWLVARRINQPDATDATGNRPRRGPSAYMLSTRLKEVESN
jgi:hypothetical protein